MSPVKELKFYVAEVFGLLVPAVCRFGIGLNEKIACKQTDIFSRMVLLSLVLDPTVCLFPTKL